MATKKENLKIDFTKREATGTGPSKKIRNKNMCPAVLYGPEYKLGLAGKVSTKSIASTANSKHKETTLIDLVLEDGKTVSTLIRDVHRHPLTQQLRHIDFYQVLKGHKIKVDIPINVINRELCEGIKDGGMINYGTRLITVDIQPSDIPEQIDFDIQYLELGSEVYIRDIPVPEGSDLVSDGDTMVLHIAQPKIVEEEVEEDIDVDEAETSPEVEVVAKGKEAKEEKDTH